MRPVSGTMLLVAAVLTSPTLAGTFTGAVPVDVALARYLVVAGVSWVLLTVAYEWFWSEPPTRAEETAPTVGDGTAEAR